MLASCSDLLTAGELVYINVEAGLMPIENDPSVVESSDLMAAIMKVENEIVLEGEEEINHSGTSLNHYHSASKLKERSNVPSSKNNSMIGQEPLHIKHDADLMPMQDDPFELKSSNSATIRVKIENEFTAVEETSRSGKSDFFSEVTESPVKKIKIEKFDIGSDYADQFITQYANSSMETDLILQTEAEEELQQTLGDGYSIVLFEEPQTCSDFNDKLFETVEIFEEAHVDYGNELFPQACDFPFPAESEDTNHSSGSGNDSLSTWQQSTTYCDTDGSELADVSSVLVDSCPKNLTNTANGFGRKRIHSESRKRVSYRSEMEKKTESGNSFESSSSSGKCFKISPEEKWVLCPLCPAGFKFMYSLTKHLAGIHKVHVCIECNGKFKRRSDLEKHLKVHTTVNQYICVFCSLKCRTEVELQSHVRIHSRHDKVFSCSQCFIGFDQSFDLVDHVLVHMNKRCSGQYKLQNEMGAKNESRKSIESTRSKESPSKAPVHSMWLLCSHCQARFKFRHSLIKHLAEEHDEYLCIKCFDRFKRKSDLQTHLKMHPAKKRYSCALCSFKCKTEAELKIHARSHSTNKAFSCAECLVEFDKCSDLLEHLPTHQNERLFSCAQCTAKFQTEADLDEHAATHLVSGRVSADFNHTSLTIPSSELEFSCKFCSAKFRRKSFLKRHLLTHSVEKLFSCMHCSALFNSKGNLKRHLDNHSERPFSCQECGAKFKVKCQFRQHLAAHEQLVRLNEKQFAKFKS